LFAWNMEVVVLNEQEAFVAVPVDKQAPQLITARSAR